MKLASGQFTRLLVAALAFVVLGAVPPVAGSTAQAAGDTPTTTILTVLRIVNVYGDVSHIRGQVRQAGGVPVTAGTVEFFDNGTSLGTKPIGSAARARLDVRLHAGTRHLTARFLGSPGLAPSDSNVLTDDIAAAESRMFTTITSGHSSLANHRRILVGVNRVVRPPNLTPSGVLLLSIDGGPEQTFGIAGRLKLPRSIPLRGTTQTIRFSFVSDFGNYTPDVLVQTWTRPCPRHEKTCGNG